MIEKKTFSRIGQLERVLKRLRREAGIDMTRVREIVEHERSHYEKATQLGYKPSYQLIVTRADDSKRSYMEGHALVTIPGEVKREDSIEIALAPSDPSFDDVNSPGNPYISGYTRGAII